MSGHFHDPATLPMGKQSTFPIVQDAMYEYLNQITMYGESGKVKGMTTFLHCIFRWLRENKHKVWDSNPTCHGPGDLGGQHIEEMAFDDLCNGQWASMTKLSPRLPIM